MIDQPHPLSAPSIRRLFARRDLAIVRHRAALGRELHLSDTEMLAVAHLAHHGALTPSRLAGLLGLSSGGTTAMIQRLEQNRHVVREPHPKDGRSSLLRLAASTAERVGAWDAPVIDELTNVAARLSDSEQRAISEFLARAAELTEAASDVVAGAAPLREEVAVDPVPSLWG
jgi:DNA-binding MarR family transcriptional regulator